MNRWIALTGIVVLGIAAVVVSERHKVDVEASPQAMLYLIADTEQELTRMPVRFTRMSDEEEIRVGNELARAYDPIWAQSENQDSNRDRREIEKYLNEVGARLAAKAHRKLPYKFHYVPEKYFINAFALPGGHVYVGAGLIALMDSEDELAAVIGHEIEHVDHYHCAERVQQEKALRKIPLGGLIQLPIEVFEAGFSKNQEMEADRDGTRLAVQAGYSPNGAVRMFEAFQRLYNDYQRRAKTPEQELSNVALQTLEGYFRSHPLPSERIQQVQQMIASEGWPVRPERDLAVGYIFWAEKADEALRLHKYAEAQHLASRALRVRADYSKALLTSAQADFAQADFSSAADSYRKLLQQEPSSRDLINRYALSLAAANRSTAATAFEDWTKSWQGDSSLPKVAGAGLALLAGNPAPARDLRDGPAWSHPDWLGELGWWYYLDGDYGSALRFLDQAVQQRPGNVPFAIHRAWALVENRRFADALSGLEGTEEPDTRGEKAMGRAVAFWQGNQPDQALGQFEAAIGQMPEWKNPQWVKKLYSPLVAQSVEEMQKERERRHKLKLAQAQRSRSLER